MQALKIMMNAFCLRENIRERVPSRSRPTAPLHTYWSWIYMSNEQRTQLWWTS